MSAAAKKSDSPAANGQPRLLARYRAEIVPELKKRLGLKNDLAVPRLVQIVISMGLGKAREEKSRVEAALKDLGTIAGQRPVRTRARASVSGFKLRQGDMVGARVTLRKQRMYEFFDRLVSIAIPRIRDFRGLNPRGFDGRGNYNFGLDEQAVFPEIDADKVEFIQGMNITIVTTAAGDREGLELLTLLGMPFRK